MYFIVENLLHGEQLEKAQRVAREAAYIDGKASARAAHDVKNNAEMRVDEHYVAIVEMVERALDSSEKVNHRLFPRFRTTPIINRYDTGMYYREHIDLPIQGLQTQFGRAPGKFGQNFVRTDYSMTLFLNPPEAYDGGELEIRIGERTELVKLPAGSAVFYQTGIPHAVRTVTRGSRICAVSWFQSLIRDANIRRTLWDLFLVEKKLVQDGQQELAEQTRAVKYNMLRYLAET